MKTRITAFLKGEAVLCVAVVCAVITMALVPPDGAYIGYIDLRVLCLLLCLMAVVAGVQSCGAFQYLAEQMLLRRPGPRALGIILVLLPFFVSVAVTNDVALITFVPFTLLLLEQLGCRRAAGLLGLIGRTRERIYLIVLQTVAANLGSMATPVGNPQNLFLYAAYELTPGDFFPVVLPLTGIALVCLAAAAAPVLPKALPAPELTGQALRNPRKLALYGVLFVLCLLTVFRVLPYGILTVIVVAALALAEPVLLKKLDYGLLATFVCFFIVSGNLGRLPAVHDLLQSLLERSTLLTGVLTSQIISNVPAAVLLSGFTENWRDLLLGVDIGGLGTPIASLASLITLKLYLRSREARPGRFLAVFTLANAAGLVILLAAAAVLVG